MKYTGKLVLRKFASAKRRIATKMTTFVTRVQGSKMSRILGDVMFAQRNRMAVKERYFIHKDGPFKKTSKYAVVLHLYYTSNWEQLFEAKLRRLSSKLDFDLYVTMPSSNQKYIPTIRQYFQQANILVVPNRGRDVLPFVKVAALLTELGYKKALKIHSKKSAHRETSSTAAAGGGALWLSNTLNALIPDDAATLDKLVLKMSSKDTGLIGALDYYYPLKMYLRYNRTIIERILKKYVDDTFFTAAISGGLDKMGYFGGTMFWIDLKAVEDVLLISKHNFHKERGQTDRTTAHALERVLCILPQIKGREVYGVSEHKVVRLKDGDGIYPKWYYDDISGGKPQISIIVPVYGDWPSLLKNIRSLKKTVGNSEDISVHYVNDCGPEADVLENRIKKDIRGLTNFYYHRNKQNLGFVRTCNRAALELVNQKDDVLLLNSDTKVTRNFLIEMRKVLYSESNIGAVTARSNNATVWSVPMTSKLANHRLMSYALYLLMKRKLPEKYITPTIHGFCVLIRRVVIDKYKLFDEIYGRGYGEENDFAMRLRHKGWKCAVANGAFVFHYESRSFGNEARNRQIEQNEKILVERYPEYRSLVQQYWDGIKEPLK